MAAGPSVAVVGAGMAGAACARALAEAGCAVAVLDKGRSVGGRLAQRRGEAGTFDHGAQYVAAASDAGFRARLDGWTTAGLVAPWPGVASGSGAPVAIGVPAMNAPVRELLSRLPVRRAARVTALRRAGRRWALALADGAAPPPLDGFDIVLLAVPAPQALALLPDDADAELRRAVAEVEMAPCAAALAVLDPMPDLDPPGQRFDDGVLAWAARNDSKPGRGSTPTLTLHGAPGWSARHLERDPIENARALLERFGRLLGRPLPEPRHLAGHRWRHALATRPAGRPAFWLPAAGLGLCGDWCLGPRVEAAYLSGAALARAIRG